MGHFLTAHPSNPLTHRVIGAAIDVHRTVGSGMLESVYQVCLAEELRHLGLAVRTQVQVPVVYRGRRLDCAFRMDLLVEETLVVEIKVVEKIAPVHVSQLLTYLRTAALEAGLLLNFAAPYLSDGGIRRVLLDRDWPPPSESAERPTRRPRAQNR